jgi:hypothetical protein
MSTKPTNPKDAIGSKTNKPKRRHWVFKDSVTSFPEHRESIRDIRSAGWDAEIR